MKRTGWIVQVRTRHGNGNFTKWAGVFGTMAGLRYQSLKKAHVLGCDYPGNRQTGHMRVVPLYVKESQ